MNDFQDNLPDTRARTLAERHIENIRQMGGMFVEAVRVTRMPMILTGATLPDNPITFANEAFIELSGYTMEELLGQDPHFMNGKDTDPKEVCRYEAAIAEGRDETLEILQYRKDGTPFRAMLFATPLKDGQGTVTNHFLSYLDVTRRYDAEEGLQSLTDELEARIAARTRELEVSNALLERHIQERDVALEALREANEQLLALATTDGLTGIGNRRAFNERLRLEWASARRYGRPLTLITLDVDHFKHYNDQFGHLAGDECLKQVAQVVANERRATDLPARVGGEEFSILLPDTDLAGALVVAGGIHSRLLALKISHPTTLKGIVTASIGVAMAIPNSRITAEDLLQAADQALYEAKRSGRDKVVSVAPLSGRHL